MKNLLLIVHIVFVGIWLVFLRAKAAEAGEWETFSALDHLQHKYGAVVLLGILVALGIGIYLFAKV